MRAGLESGKFGEDYAVRFLEKKRYRILGRNFRCRQGEIDIIAADESYLVFAEVKLRKNNRYGEAREFVTIEKQQRIIKTAQLWLACHPTVLQPRFDVIEIYAPFGDDRNLSIEHIENAFD